jgi:hypothetical protein
MYTAKSENCWGSKFTILDQEGAEAGIISYNMWNSEATVVVGGKSAVVKNQSWYSQNRIIFENGKEVGRADIKLFSFKPRAEVTYKTAAFTIQAVNSWMTVFELRMKGSDRPLGTISKKGVLSTSYVMDIEQPVELWFQAVLVTLLITIQNYVVAVS